MLLTNSVTGATIGSQSTGVQVTDTVTDLTPQPLKDTGEPLDFAINGDGFFAVQTADGTRYTRNGEFASDDSGPADDARPATPSSAATTSRSRSAPTARSTRACSTSSCSATRRRPATTS